MRAEEIEKLPVIIDMMLGESVIVDTKEKLHEKLTEVCNLAIKALEQEPNTWCMDDAREDFMYDVYNTLDFLPTNDEANQIIDSFDRVTSSIMQEPRWIPVTERLPEDKINPITEDYSEYQCTVRFGNLYDVRSYKYGEGHWRLGAGIVDDFVIAWRELPKPYKAESEIKE